MTINLLIQTYGWPMIVLFTALIIWSLVWKGLALWKAAKNNNLKWFIALLVVNSAGILEILYICVFSRKRE